MKYLKVLVLTSLLISVSFAQNQTIPDYYKIDTTLSNQLYKIVEQLGLNKDFNVGSDGVEQISLAVIDLSKGVPSFGGVNPANFIYPASVYKMYVAAEVLHQISEGKYSLFSEYIVKAPNAVDKSKEIKHDPRPLLKENDTVTVNYLLDLMITRSDNTAANCLIDLAKRENINKMMSDNYWHGSEVTRKFLSRKFEDQGYEKVNGTETSALHAADFIYKVMSGKLFNKFVCTKLSLLLGNQLDDTKLAQGLPKNTLFYHKTGWFSYWTNDVGLVFDDNVKYVISCFLPIPEEEALPLMKVISEEIYKIMLNRTVKK